MNRFRPCWLALPALLLASCGSSGPAPEPDVVSAERIDVNGFALKAETVELPVGELQFPDGPGADLVDAHCIACHSPGMALTQPKLSAAQWRSIVVKMRDVYKAPVEDADIDGIVGYFLAFQKGAATG